MATKNANETRTGEPYQTRKVYVIEKKEVISYSFYVIANSKTEALEIFDEADDYSDWDRELELEDSEGIYKIDGSYDFHRCMKPTVKHSFKQVLKPKIYSHSPNYTPLKWMRLDENDEGVWWAE